MYEQALVKTIDPVKKTTISRLNKGKKWKYDVAAGEILAHHEWKSKTYPLMYDPVK